MKPTIPFAALGILLLLASCAPSSGKTPPANAPNPAGTPQGTTAPPPRGQVPPQPQGAKTPPPPHPVPPPVSRPFNESLLTGKEFLLQMRPVSAYQKAEDFNLGPLGTEPDAAVSAAKKFLASLSAKTFDPAQAAPRWVGYLRAKFNQLLEKNWNWSHVRWAPRKEPEEGGVLLEFLSRQGNQALKGLMYLSSPDKQTWLVEDLQVNEVTDTEAFDPETQVPGLLSP